MTEATARTTGKWSQPGVPHKGWTCIDIEDLGTPSATCEMFEAQEIRYAHYMQHPLYAEVLACGCVCAGNMENDYQGAQHREKGMRSASSRRKRWLTRDWRVSRSGNPFINTDRYNIVVYTAGSGWTFRIENRSSGNARMSRQTFGSSDNAKLRAFDAMMWMKQHRE